MFAKERRHSKYLIVVILCNCASLRWCFNGLPLPLPDSYPTPRFFGLCPRCAFRALCRTISRVESRFFVALWLGKSPRRRDETAGLPM